MRWLLLLFSFSVFASDNWIVVTTIQYPTPQLCHLAQEKGWELVVVGDTKTPDGWELEGATYLSIEDQKALGFELAELLPTCHYARKNIGYLYAISKGAKVIYDTDDDNVPIGKLLPFLL